MDFQEPHTFRSLLHSFDVTGDSVATIYDTGIAVYRTTYENLKDIADKIEATLRRNIQASCGGFVGVFVEQCEIFPAILVGILQTGTGFYCLDPDLQDWQEEFRTLHQLGIHYLIAEHETLIPESSTIAVFELHLVTTVSRTAVLVQLRSNSSVSCGKDNETIFSRKPYEWAYAIKTSGTTSDRKLVLVSHQSIVPNVDYFIETFKLLQGDVVYGASPSTFDPHVVDVFMALKSGSTVLYAPKAVKLSPKKLIDLCVREGVTVMQCTPSFFYRFDFDEACTFVASANRLRLLGFGGETCPNREYLRKIVPPERRSKLAIYNLYGTTELSCWASVDRVNLDYRLDTSVGILQNMLPDTHYKLVGREHNAKEVLLGSQHRRCLIVSCADEMVLPPALEEHGVTYRRTGDIIDTDELPLIVYKCRTDNRMKRQGHFVDLHDLEQRLNAIPLIENAVCFGDFGKVYAVISLLKNDYDQHQERGRIFDEIQRRVPIRSMPDHVTILYPNQIQLTANGKLDMKTLKEVIIRNQLGILETNRVSVDTDDLHTILETAWSLFTGVTFRIGNTEFLESGGDSVKAMQLVEYVFQELNLFGTAHQQRHSPAMLRILIRSNFSDLAEYLKKVVVPQVQYNVTMSSYSDAPSQPYDCCPKTDYNRISFSSRLFFLQDSKTGADHPEVQNQSLQPYPYHIAYNLYGCVDATPILVQHPELGHLVIATSNSGYVVAIQSHPKFSFGNASENVLWFKKFPDRIVASAAVSLDQLTLFIACCDCRLYAVETCDGHVKWNHFCGGLLLTSPVVTGELVIFTAGDEYVLGLNQKGRLHWKVEVPGLKSSLAPRLSLFNVFVATDTQIVRIHQDHGTVVEELGLHGVYAFECNAELQLLCVATANAAVTGTSVLHLYSFRKKELHKLWRSTLTVMTSPSFLTFPASGSCYVFFVTRTGCLTVVNVEDGKICSEIELPYTPSSTSTPKLLLRDGYTRAVIVASEATRIEIYFVNVKQLEGHIKLSIDLDKDVMKLYTERDEPILTSVLIDDDVLVFGRRDDQLYFIKWREWSMWTEKLLD